MTIDFIQQSLGFEPKFFFPLLFTNFQFLSQMLAESSCVDSA